MGSEHLNNNENNKEYLFWKNAAGNYLEQNQIDNAIEAIEKALAFPEGLSDGQNYLTAGNIYFVAEKYDRACICLDMARMFMPDNWRIFALKGLCLAKIGIFKETGSYKGTIAGESKQNFEDSLKMFDVGLEKARADNDDYGEGYLQGNRALLLLRNGDEAAAQLAITEAFRLNDPSGEGKKAAEIIINNKKKVTSRETYSKQENSLSESKESVIDVYMYGIIGAKMYGFYEGTPEVRFSLMFLNNREKLAEKVRQRHPEFYTVLDFIHESNRSFAEGGSVLDVSKEADYVLEKIDLISDVFYAVLVAGYIAFLDRNSKDRTACNNSISLVEDAIVKYGDSVTGAAVFVLCSALWFNNYHDIRKIVYLNVENFVNEDWYKENVVDLSQLKENYLVFLQSVMDKPVSANDLDYDDTSSIWEEAGSMDECAELAEKYYFGKGRIHNFKKAFELAEIPAYKGNKLALYLTGRMLFSGEGTQKNEKEGLAILQKLTIEGYEDAKQFIISEAENHIQDYDRKLKFVNSFSQRIKQAAKESSEEQLKGEIENGRRYIEYYRELSKYIPISDNDRGAFIMYCFDVQPELLFTEANAAKPEDIIREFDILLESGDDNSKNLLKAATEENMNIPIMLDMIDAVSKGKSIDASQTNWAIVEKYILKKAAELGIPVKPKN